MLDVRRSISSVHGREPEFYQNCSLDSKHRRHLNERPFSSSAERLSDPGLKKG